jgi:hypothetical protein
MNVRDLVADEPRRTRELSTAFAKAFQAGDLEGMARLWAPLEETVLYGMRHAFRQCAALQSVPENAKEAFLRMWLSNGDSLRQAVSNDLILVKALRVMLPSYTGSAMTIYRGESKRNRWWQTYGASWSTDIEVARGFARSRAKMYEGGAVLLRTEAPTEAIVLHINDFVEDECIVDRRLLGRVEVLERYPNA